MGPGNGYIFLVLWEVMICKRCRHEGDLSGKSALLSLSCPITWQRRKHLHLQSLYTFLDWSSEIYKSLLTNVSFPFWKVSKSMVRSQVVKQWFYQDTDKLNLADLAGMQVPYFLVVIKQGEVPQAAVKVAALQTLLTLSVVHLSHDLYCICLIGVI